MMFETDVLRSAQTSLDMDHELEQCCKLGVAATASEIREQREMSCKPGLTCSYAQANWRHTGQKHALANEFCLKICCAATSRVGEAELDGGMILRGSLTSVSPTSPQPSSKKLTTLPFY